MELYLKGYAIGEVPGVCSERACPAKTCHWTCRLLPGATPTAWFLVAQVHFEVRLGINGMGGFARPYQLS